MSHFGKYIFRIKSFLPRYGIYFLKWYVIKPKTFVNSKRRVFQAGKFFSQSLSTISNRNASSNYKTMSDIKEQLGQRLEREVYLSEKNSKEYFEKHIVKSQSELPIRKMKDSFDIAIVPLSSNKRLRDRYITSLGTVRVGRLMEDVDLFAVWCCTKHLTEIKADEEKPVQYTIVTIRVDHIEMFKSLLQPENDIRISGHVSWVGTSSLEVIIWLDQLNKEKEERIMTALLLMAARNRMTMGPSIVNQIEAETLEEKLLLQGGEKRKQQRLKLMNESLLKVMPTEEEFEIIHDLFIKTMDSKETFRNKKILPPKSKWMRDASMSNLVFCHPQYRNLHNKIFGGFLIRQALELSWSAGFLFGMRIPKLIHISDIGFYSPVEVGSMLKLSAGVTYVEDELIQVFVHAEAVNLATKSGRSTTSFNFTYTMDGPFDTLYPYTYLEAMKYIDGRRHLHEFKKLNGQNYKAE